MTYFVPGLCWSSFKKFDNFYTVTENYSNNVAPESNKTKDKIVAKLWDDNYKYKADTNIMRTFKEHGFIPPTEIRTDYFFKPYE